MLILCKFSKHYLKVFILSNFLLNVSPRTKILEMLLDPSPLNHRKIYNAFTPFYFKKTLKILNKFSKYVVTNNI